MMQQLTTTPAFEAPSAAYMQRACRPRPVGALRCTGCTFVQCAMPGAVFPSSNPLPLYRPQKPVNLKAAAAAVFTAATLMVAPIAQAAIDAKTADSIRPASAFSIPSSPSLPALSQFTICCCVYCVFVAIPSALDRSQY